MKILVLCYLLGSIPPHFCPCRDRNDLAEVVALLKTQIDPELLKRDELLKQQNKADGEDEEKEGGLSNFQIVNIKVT